MSELYARKRVAIRKLLLKDGMLTRDARLLLADMRKFCKADNQGGLQHGQLGIDVNATIAAVARREVFDRYVRMLNLDHYTTTNLSEEI